MQANKLSHLPKSHLNTSVRRDFVEAKLISSTVSHPRGLSSLRDPTAGALLQDHNIFYRSPEQGRMRL